MWVARHGFAGPLGEELINREAGIKLQQVPYRSAADNMNDLIGNHVSLAIQPTISVGEQVRAGNAVALAVTSAQRNAVFQDVPTFAELGYPKVRGTAWFWLTGPKGINPAIVARLNLAVRQLLKSPRVQEQFASMALQTQDLDLPELNQFLAEEVALWGALAKEIGLRVQ